MVFINNKLRDLYEELDNLDIIDNDDMSVIVNIMQELDEHIYDDSLWCPPDKNGVPVRIGDSMMVDGKPRDVIGISDDNFFFIDEDDWTTKIRTASLHEHKPEAWVIMVDPESEAETIKADPNYKRPDELRMVFSSLKVATRYLDSIGYGTKYPAGTIWVEEFDLDTNLK